MSIRKISDRPTRPVDMTSDDFLAAGMQLLNRIAHFLEDLPQLPVTKAEHPKQVRAVLGDGSLPREGLSAWSVLNEAAQLLFDHSLFNGHPRFWGYITSSAMPVGALGDLLAAAVNPNVGAYILSPMATEIERQTVRWLAEFIGYSEQSGGLFVSGGNMANMIGFLAARKAKADWDIRKYGLGASSASRMTLYCAAGTHTWVEKAADVFGLGTDSIRWIITDANQKLSITHLEKRIVKDIHDGYLPFLVIGNAGSVSTGTIDPLEAIAKVCRKYNLWFHVDGAYGAPAAALPEYGKDFKGIAEADSVAIDPHKWLYAPLEAGCILVRNPQHLTDTFSFHPEYYNFAGDASDPMTNFYDFGLQNSRGFRALKVWLGLKQTGLSGYQEMIRRDIELAKHLFNLVSDHEELEALSHNLSITTFRFIPKSLRREKDAAGQYLNKLNETLLNRLQAGGEVFLSNAVINGQYCLRVCIVNFRTTPADLEDLVAIVLREGRETWKEMAE